MSSKNIEFEELENSIVDGLMERYEQTSYLASSPHLIQSSIEQLSRDLMDEIFQEQSKYYPQLKKIETSIKHVTVFIPPEVARDMLRFSARGAINPEHKNRKVSKKMIQTYSEAMKNSKWCLTGEPIILSADGEILNGHTRLEAAAESGKGFVTVLTYGVTDDLSFAHIDTGKIRSRAQVLEMAGVKVDAETLSKVAMLAKSFEQTKNKYAFRGTQGTSFQQAEILHYVEAHEELALSVDLVSKLAKKHKQEIQAAQHIYAFAHYLIKAKLRESSIDELTISPETYLSRVISGIGIQSEEDTEYQVRKYLQTLVGESNSYALLCRLSSIFKGWNHYHSIPIVANKIAVRRVAKYTKDEDGNRIPAKGARNINEAFTIPYEKKGKSPLRIQSQANVKVV